MGVGQFCVLTSLLFGFEGGMWDLVVLSPDRCISIYLVAKREESREGHIPRRVLQVSVFF